MMQADTGAAIADDIRADTGAEPRTLAGAPESSAPAGAPLCPYCGHEQPNHGATQCAACRGLFEPLSRQATQNAMGPWQIRDEANPFRPGCSYDTLRALALRGKIDADTAIRGPSTRQFWQRAGETQGVAHLFGRCHACRARARVSDSLCQTCAASFAPPADRQRLNLLPVRPLTGPGAPRADARTADDTENTPRLEGAPFARFSTPDARSTAPSSHAAENGAPAIDARSLDFPFGGAHAASGPTPAPRPRRAPLSARALAPFAGALGVLAVAVIAAAAFRTGTDAAIAPGPAGRPLSPSATPAEQIDAIVRNAGASGPSSTDDAIRALRRLAAAPDASPDLLIRVESEVARLTERREAPETPSKPVR